MSKMMSNALPESHTSASRCVAGITKSSDTLDVFVEALDVGWSVLGKNSAPEFRAKADDEVHAACSGSWLANGCDGGGKLLAFGRVENVKFQVRMRRGSKGEDSSLRRVHAEIISGVSLGQYN